MSARALALVAVASALVALVLALHRLGATSLWLDETFTVVDAARPWADVIAWRSERWSPHPPLYYAVVKATMAVCGSGEACVRAPSALAHAGAAALAATIAGRLFGILPAITTGALWATLPYAIKYAQQARHYPLLALLGLAAAALAIRGLDLDERGPARRRVFVGLGLVAAAMVWTHLFALPLLGALVLFVLGWIARAPRSRWWSALRPWLAAAAVATVAIAPLIPPLVAHWRGDPGGHFASRPGAVENADELVRDLATLATDAWPLAALVLPAWVLARRRVVHVGLIALAFAPLVAVVVRNPAHFVPLRYFMPSVAIVAIAIGSGWGLAAAAVLGPRARPTRVLAAACVVLGVGVAIGVRFTADLRRHFAAAGFERWDRVAAFVATHAGVDDVVAAVPHELVRWPLVAYDPARAVLDPAAPGFAADVERATRVFVVASHIDRPERRAVRQAALRRLTQLGFVRERWAEAPSDEHVELMVYRRRAHGP